MVLDSAKWKRSKSYLEIDNQEEDTARYKYDIND